MNKKDASDRGQRQRERALWHLTCSYSAESQGLYFSRRELRTLVRNENLAEHIFLIYALS